MYICTYKRMHVRMYVYMYVCMYVRTYICIYKNVSMYLCMHVRVQSIQNMWDSLLYKLDSRKGTLTRQRDLMTVFNEMDDCLTDMGIIQVCIIFTYV